MDFSEDNKLVKQGRKYNRKASRWEDFFRYQLSFEPSFLTVLDKAAFVILGILIQAAFNTGFGGLILGILVSYVVLLVVKFVLYKVFAGKEKAIWRLHS